NRPLISIVVPVFNVAEFLKELILSIQNQEVDFEYEVIFVDDGSSDGSRFVLQQFTKKMYRASNVKIISKEKNAGIAEARNTGIAAANGQYIMHLDSDDFLVDNTLYLIGAALQDQQPDCLAVDGNMWWWYNSIWHQKCELFPPKKLLALNTDVMAMYIREEKFYAWKYIVKAEIAKQHLFYTGRVFEDVTTLPMLIIHCETLYYYPLAVINYRQREGSTSKKRDFKNLAAMSDATHLLMQELQQHYQDELPQEMRLPCAGFCIKQFVWCCLDALKNSEVNYKQLHHYLKDNFIKNTKIFDKEKRIKFSSLRTLKSLEKELNVRKLDIYKFYFSYHYGWLYF
ncbi:MAG: hypothetical protein CSA42_08655, partial [Gammaproteobacteria bacterium]